MTILRGGTFGAELQSEFLERSSSPSDSAFDGVPPFGLLALEPEDELEGFGLLAFKLALGLLRSVFTDPLFWPPFVDMVPAACFPDLAHCWKYKCM
jgi:hypothetical protein